VSLSPSATVVSSRPLSARTLRAPATTASARGVIVNDVHAQLNATRVRGIVTPRTVEDLRSVLAAAKSAGVPLSIAGGRHSMGGQQFGEDTLLVDTRALARLTSFDADRGHVTVGGGIQWPELLSSLERIQRGRPRPWGIVQKQTGADRLSLAGALSCNAHGRGLTLGPIVQQVESFDLLDHSGTLRTCSRTHHADLFRLAIGGYGLFGVITQVTLRLQPRVKVRRVVEIGRTDGIIERFADRIRDGFLYGDYQFSIDTDDDDFLRRGVFSCYEPVPDKTPLTEQAVHFSPEEWSRLTLYAHCDKRRAFELYSSRYLQTSGQIYWSDAQLSSAYVDDYHGSLDRTLDSPVKGSEMITELYVPRPALARFMEEARAALRHHRANVIYGTVRLIEQDDETFLPWARQRYACIVFNLHVDHTLAAIALAADTFRALIDLAAGHDGSYYLTYHRWARKDQVLRCYPQMPAFLAAKRREDPGEVFQSDWYRHYRRMFMDAGPSEIS
jgi:FAD/FMN-containing dehydrogenase